MAPDRTYPTATAPQTRGTISDYLCEAQAQARGAVPASFRVAGLEPLTGGRTGARVIAIRPGYVLKVLPRNTWRVAAMQAPQAGEVPLWLSGATRSFPRRLRVRQSMLRLADTPDPGAPQARQRAKAAIALARTILDA